MNYLVTAISINFFAANTLNRNIIDQAGGLKDRIRPMNGYDFANELDRILNMYPPEITYAQLNLLDSHDMPRSADARRRFLSRRLTFGPGARPARLTR